MSEISSRPQSISCSSMGTSRGCHSCVPELSWILTEGSLDVSKHANDLFSSPPADHTDEEHTDETSFLLSTIEGTLETEERCTVGERVIGLVVPFGVVRVKTPGTAQLKVGRFFKGDFPSNLISSCACILMSSRDGV